MVVKNCHHHYYHLQLIILIAVAFLLSHGLQVGAQKINDRYEQRKVSGFDDPNTHHLYRVVQFDVKTMAANATFRSIIQVSRLKLNDTDYRNPVNKPERVQTIKFNPLLVDFDLHCSPKYCYMVAVTSKSKRNLELYAWQRTQFDLMSKRDTFARPNEVRLFEINDQFYIAVAQEQLQLDRSRIAQISEESTRFIGCAILRFTKGNELKTKYHQFIRLPFHPKHVMYFNTPMSNNSVQQVKNYYLVFSEAKNWYQPGIGQHREFIWSPLNEYFWPHRLPKGIVVQHQKSFESGYLVQFPKEPTGSNVESKLVDYTQATESCFQQLQRILYDRDIRSRKMIDSSHSVWRKVDNHKTKNPAADRLTKVSSQVIVHGNVTVIGSMIESPQVSIVGAQHLPQPVPSPLPVVSTRVVSDLMKSFAPASINNRLKLAQNKLHYMHDKLMNVVKFNLPITTINGPVRLHNGVRANEVQLRGVANSDIHFNAMKFKQLETELVSLSGSQILLPQVKFTGPVVADMLEIHGLINDRYRLRDAIDITSRHPQVIETLVYAHGFLSFASLSAPEIRMSPRATVNTINLGEFITRDNRTQEIYGRKEFKHLTVSRLDLAHSGVPLNNYNLTRLSLNAIRLRDPAQARKIHLHGNQVNFLRPLYANKLYVNNAINRHINLSLMIQDSVKTNDGNVQQIHGYKSFLNGLKINRLSTQGKLNGIKIDDVFNLNQDARGEHQVITGSFKLHSLVDIVGNLSSRFVNGIPLRQVAVRRSIGDSPVIVRGLKVFGKPLRILNNVTLLDPVHAANISARPPLINDIDLRDISKGLARQMSKPSTIIIRDLEIVGNFDLPSQYNSSYPPIAIFNNTIDCPLDAIKSRLILAAREDQLIDIPIQVETLRAKSVDISPSGLNGMSFPEDFVLRNSRNHQTIHGHKSFEHITIHGPNAQTQYKFNRPESTSIRLDVGVDVNGLGYNQLIAFARHESRLNSTGEQVFDTIDVVGNINARRINSHNWPEDLLLKSIGTGGGPSKSPYIYNRIYSPLVFLNSSLQVEGLLSLSGPVKLLGRLNGVNLTEFSHQSATYGDKDLYYNRRPLRNKVFLGGITVENELRSQGSIDGVNIDEMRQRVVTINSGSKRQQIVGPKVFMSDTTARGPINMFLLDEVPMDKYLSRVHFQPGGSIVFKGKKFISGALRINKQLLLDARLNGIDFAEYNAKAISLSKSKDGLQLNSTMTIEGNAFIDDLLLDEKDGKIDGVSLQDLEPARNVASPIATPRDALDDRIYHMTGPFARNRQMAHLRPQPISINYEHGLPASNQMISARYQRSVSYTELGLQLKNHLIPLGLLSFSSSSNLVIGFIDAQNQGLEGYQLPMTDSLHSDHPTDDLRRFMVLDQFDYDYNAVAYHLSAVLSKDPTGRNSTSVLSSIGGGPHELLSALPVEHPNDAIFIFDKRYKMLFLMVSQDYSVNQGRGFVCPISDRMPFGTDRELLELNRVDGNVHVYLFHVYQNSSSVRSAYFDIFQTVDLPEIDSFSEFQYDGSIYALAASRATQRIYLLILRGFSGFQIVSHIESPMMEHMEVILDNEEKPAIVIYQSNGSQRVLESVII